MTILVRILLLAAAVGIIWAAVAFLERRPPRRSSHPPGVTLLYGPDCRLCEPARAALTASGIEVRVVEVGDAGRRSGPVMSLPTAIVVDGTGAVVLRRAGRSVITDLAQIVAAARSVPSSGR